jgi:hypothetical protein
MEMNGVNPTPTPLDGDQQGVVKLLEGLLVQAKAGEISCLAAVVIKGHKNYTTTGTLNGLYLMEMALGGQDLNDMARGTMKQIAMQQAQQAQQSKPGIVRPPPGFDPRKGG